MVSVLNLSKVYPLYARPVDRLVESLPFAGTRHTDFAALRDISFDVAPGEMLALVGPNGCGKSTLLQIVAGILPPTRGLVRVQGRIAALLELGAGFNPEFTGRENVFLNAELLGLSRPAISRVLPQIEAFAEIGAFLDRPVKEYSTGMYVRLAFATAIHVEPEVLIVDEALAVGDARFANRCVRKFDELKQRGVTTLFVSHDLGLVKRLADRAIFLLNGRMEYAGDTAEAINRYVAHVHTADVEPVPASLESAGHGDGESRITNVRLLPSDKLASGDELIVEATVQFHTAQAAPVCGLLIRNRQGLDVYGTNTRVEGTGLGPVEAGETVVVRFALAVALARGEYTVTVATQHPNGASQDWLDDVLAFSITHSKDLAGVADLAARIEVLTHAGIRNSRSSA
ncbi:MAG: ABC transporter ATP-binding protein [Bryobacteraceae bacterium]|nr:ABC transporter ATP-binding protein [Bryobacteraceae bacterium]